MNKQNRKKLLWITIVCLLVALMVFAIHYAGTFLIRRDTIVKGDAIVILMGSIADRVLEASDLYNQNLAGKLLIVEENVGSVNLLKSRGGRLISNTEQCRNVAVDLGIPDSCITIIPGEATSTKMEARLVSQFINNNGMIDTLLIVTSPAHTRRAGLIFSNAFKKYGLNVTVITCPSKYSSYTGVGWFKHREEIQEVVYEYIKLSTFLLIEQFRKP